MREYVKIYIYIYIYIRENIRCKLTPPNAIVQYTSRKMKFSIRNFFILCAVILLAVYLGRVRNLPFLQNSCKLFSQKGRYHCVKSIQIRSFFWSLFPCIRTKYRKIRTRKTPYLDTFYELYASVNLFFNLDSNLYFRD